METSTRENVFSKEIFYTQYSIKYKLHIIQKALKCVET